jgi:hypothetical protein
LRNTYKHFLQYVLYVDDLEFKASKAREVLNQHLELPELDGPIVVSDEQFYGSPWDGCALRKRNSDRIAAIFPDAQIVVVLRNQRDVLQSLYLQYIKTGGSAHWGDFLKSKAHPLVTSCAYYKYGHYVNYLIDTFGKDRIKVLLYEDFELDPSGYLNQWCTILGIETNSWDKSILSYGDNPSISPSFVPVMRLTNKFTSSIRQPYLLLPRFSHKVTLKCMIKCSAFFRQKVRKWLIPVGAVEAFLVDCHESNRLLEQLINRDLGGLGYPGVGQSVLARK